ncbi:AraC family transcriptional regulator [Comamonas odontotermitis]|uniref:AraC family transcriptional regulator n=1 Tax=Comamonas odontotermitis TaxID=379895 RepID=UPI003751F86C
MRSSILLPMPTPPYSPDLPAPLTGAARAAISNYTMATRAQHAYFGIHDQSDSLPNPVPHRHEYFQIYVSIRGETTHYIGGSQRPIGPGTVSFVQPFMVHYIPNAPDGIFHIINISKDYLLPSLDHDVLELAEVPLIRAPELAPFRFQHCLDFRFDDIETRQLQELCIHMAREAKRNPGEDPASQLLVRSYLLQLLGMVWRRYHDQFRELDARGTGVQTHKQAVVRCVRFITRHLAHELTLNEAAQASCVSATHLAHLLKSETGRTFLELVTERRMERAKTLLAFTSESAASIGESIGFSDPTHFARRFRQIEGLTPSAYRLRVQRKERSTLQ